MSSRFANLQTLVDVQATPRAVPKVGSKLKRAIARRAARVADTQRLVAWARAVKERDQWKDRKTGQRVLSTRRLDPMRAEAHHIEPRENLDTRYDVRNGICLSFATHFLVTHHKLRIEGTVFFRKGGALYIDATFPVIFVRC